MPPELTGMLPAEAQAIEVPPDDKDVRLGNKLGEFALSNIENQLSSQEQAMKSLSAAFVIAVTLCATPFSLRWSHGNGMPLSPAFDSAVAAELNIPVLRHHRRYAAYNSRSYDRFCGGPYVGSGFNGGTYYGGPWIDLRCYGYVY
jgi:hypothetical protein